MKKEGEKGEKEEKDDQDDQVDEMSEKIRYKNIPAKNANLTTQISIPKCSAIPLQTPPIAFVSLFL